MNNGAVFFIVLFIGLAALIGLTTRRGRQDEWRPKRPAGEAPPRRLPRLKREIPPPEQPIARLRIEYADAFGVLTERSISIIRIDVIHSPDGAIRPEKLRAYCHMRRGYRTFKVYRIQKLFLPDQPEPLRYRGEIHNWFAHLFRRTAKAPNAIVTPE